MALGRSDHRAVEVFDPRCECNLTVRERVAVTVAEAYLCVTVESPDAGAYV
jgi:hypothetical protein